MNSLVTGLLQCSAFLLIPAVTFGSGLWFIIKFVGFNNRAAFLWLAVLIGFSFFVTSLIGILIDPRTDLSNWGRVVKISGLIGFVVFIAVLIFVPIFRALIRVFK